MRTQEQLLEIPFYQQRIKRSSDTPRSIIISKKEINQSFPNEWMTDLLRSAIDDRQVEWAATSGTTSERLQIIRPKNWWDGEYAWLDQQLFPNHANGDVRRVVLTTALCSAQVCSMSKPSYEERCLGNALFVNVHHDPNVWQTKDIQQIFAEITRWAPDYLLADPVYLGILLKKAVKHHISLPDWCFTKVILGYEYLTSFNKRFIETYFPRQEIRQLYGSTETGFHILEDGQGELQCHHRDGHIQLKHLRNDIYQVFITSWKNPFMPLVNYDIGDLVTMDDPISENALPERIASFQGRLKESFMDRDRLITVGLIDTQLSKLDLPILQYQLQLYPDVWKFIYTTMDDHALSSEEASTIVHTINRKVNPSVDIVTQHQMTITPSGSGKFNILANHIR